MDILNVKTIWADDELKQNTYIVEGDGGCIVIDVGCPIDMVYKHTTKPIKAVFITHGHYDHIAYIQQYDKLNIPIYASKYIQELLLDSNKNATSMFSTPKVYKVKNINYLQDNQQIKVINTIVNCYYTPGHSVDGMSYLIGANLFTGDTLFSVAVGRVDLPTANANQLVASLNKIKQINYKNIYPGHGRISDYTEQAINIPTWIKVLKN